MKNSIALSVLAFLLSGCATSYTSNLADGFNPRTVRNRNIVIFRNSHILSNTLMAGNAFKSFERDGITAKEFDRRIDSIFFRAVKGDAGMVGLRIDDTTRCDSLRAMTSVDGKEAVHVILPARFPNASDLYLAIGIISYDLDGQFNPDGGPVFLRARSTYVLYDPLAGAAVADGRISVISSSLLGHLITQSDWYADARKTGDELISRLIEFH